MTKLTDPRGKITVYTYETGGCSSCGTGGGGRLKTITDHDNNVTEFFYDEHGNRTKVIDALGRETDYAYDARNRLESVTSPSGSSNVMSYQYTKLGRMKKSISFEGEKTEYLYDWAGRVTKVTKAGISNEFIYTGLQLTKVKDGLGHEWNYAYDSNKRLSTLTDPVGKITKYFYDAQGRMTKVGAGSTGAFDPTEYLYDATTGKLQFAKYTAGANDNFAGYVYDGAGKLTKLRDWIDWTDGLQYAYDDAGKLTTLSDYDGDNLAYVYDAAGNVTAMTDYHNNTTSYTYTNLNQLDTITAPGSKVWDYTYNALGQPTQYTHPNGMTTAYTYDTRNRMTKIEHKDGNIPLDPPSKGD